MHLTLWAFVPLVAAPLVAVVLVVLLQRLLTLRGIDAEPGAAMWKAVTAHWHPLVTGLLPILVGIVLVILVAWPFAYLGWYVIYLSDDPMAQGVFPPWFGNPGFLLLFGVAGVMIALVAVLMGVAITFIAYFIGKCTIWPDACGCIDNDDDRIDTNGSAPNE